MPPKKSNRKDSDATDEHNEMSDENKEQYVTKELFNEQMQSMMELLSSSIQTNISDAMRRHVVNSSTTEDVSAAAGATSNDGDVHTIEKSNIHQLSHLCPSMRVHERLHCFLVHP